MVHARRETYRTAIGRGGEQSFGSSWIDARKEGICGRRIDLLIDARGAISALGHELTHLVIADAFPGRQPPVWANEGAALLADSAEKQRLHQRDLAHALARQASFHFAELMQLSTYPRSERVAVFYAQSASLTAYLIAQGGTEKFLPFVRLASDVGYDQALAECYEIRNAAELQQRWLAEVHKLDLTAVARRSERVKE